jgi:hypothetical protein
MGITWFLFKKKSSQIAKSGRRSGMIHCGFHRIFYKKNLAKLLKVAQERKRRKNKRSFKHYSNANEEAQILSQKKTKPLRCQSCYDYL